MQCSELEFSALLTITSFTQMLWALVLCLALVGAQDTVQLINCEPALRLECILRCLFEVSVCAQAEAVGTSDKRGRSTPRPATSSRTLKTATAWTCKVLNSDACEYC